MNYLLRNVKVLAGVFMFSLLCLLSTDVAKAESVNNVSGSDTVIANTSEISEEDMQAIMSELDGRQITDGDSFIVNGEYEVNCRVVVEPVSESSSLLENSLTASSANSTLSDSLYSTASTSTQNYVATCYVDINTVLYSGTVASIVHQVSITNYDTGLVHINSGSLSVNPYSSAWSGYAYGYSINNTNGSYSSASGMARLYNSVSNAYIYYGASVTVYPGCSPNFTFNQV